MLPPGSRTPISCMPYGVRRSGSTTSASANVAFSGVRAQARIGLNHDGDRAALQHRESERAVVHDVGDRGESEGLALFVAVELEVAGLALFVAVALAVAGLAFGGSASGRRFAMLGHGSVSFHCTSSALGSLVTRGIPLGDRPSHLI
jgi:hypothetical protein